MVEVIITLIVAVFGSTGFWAWLNGRRNKRTDESRLLMGLAYSEIIRRSEDYIARGWVDVNEYNELNHYLFEPYRGMGGDGTAEKLMSEVGRLPMRKEA